MKKKITQKPLSDTAKIAQLIKSLGGAKSIHNYLISKNKNIKIESIYKWKTNGIPYRYRSEIKELSDSNSVILPADSFSNNNIDDKKAEIISNSNNNYKLHIKNNIFLYLLIIISAFSLLYIFYNTNNVYKLNQKILVIEKALVAISSSNDNRDIASLKKINQTHNELINKHSRKIDEISITSNKVREIINKMEKDISNLTSTESQHVNSNQNNSSYILFYLMDIKNDIKFSNPNLSQINYISDYFENVSLPSEVELSLKNLRKLSNIELIGHKKIIKKVSSVLLTINTPIKENIVTENTFFDKFKNLIKITRKNNDEIINIDNTNSQLNKTLNNHNYNHSLHELELINKKSGLDESIQDIKNIKILYESVDTIIKWLIFKG